MKFKNRIQDIVFLIAGIMGLLIISHLLAVVCRGIVA